MTMLMKPKEGNPDYPETSKQAVSRALRDANLSYKVVEMASVGYVYGESTCGQRALYEVGMTGIPIYNVNNNCASGSSALHMCYNLISGGAYSCGLALGFEKMERGSVAMRYPDRVNPLDKTLNRSKELNPGKKPIPPAPFFFNNAG